MITQSCQPDGQSAIKIFSRARVGISGHPGFAKNRRKCINIKGTAKLKVTGGHHVNLQITSRYVPPSASGPKASLFTELLQIPHADPNHFESENIPDPNSWNDWSHLVLHPVHPLAASYQPSSSHHVKSLGTLTFSMALRSFRLSFRLPGSLPSVAT